MKYTSHLIRLILPLYAVQYAVMYWLGLPANWQWYAYDFGNALIRFIMVLYVFLVMRYKTFHYEIQKNKRIVTGILAIEGYSLLGEMFNLQQKGNMFEVIWGAILILFLTRNFK